MALTAALGALSLSAAAKPVQSARLSSRLATPTQLRRAAGCAPRAAAPRAAQAAIAEPAAAPAAEPEAKATLNSQKGSVFKVRRILDVIRGRDYEEALMILEFMPQRCCEHIQNLVLSCASNAKNNLGMKKSSLYISEAFADQGPYLRRFQPRAQGRAYAIRKPTCSINVKMKSHDSSKRARKPIKLSTN